MTNDADRDDREPGRNRQPPRRDGSPSAEAILTALSNGIGVLDAQRSPDGVAAGRDLPATGTSNDGDRAMCLG
jgi:hypothetical protein